MCVCWCASSASQTTPVNYTIFYIYVTSTRNWRNVFLGAQFLAPPTPPCSATNETPESHTPPHKIHVGGVHGDVSDKAKVMGHYMRFPLLKPTNAGAVRWWLRCVGIDIVWSSPLVVVCVCVVCSSSRRTVCRTSYSPILCELYMQKRINGSSAAAPRTGVGRDHVVGIIISLSPIPPQLRAQYSM